MRCHLRSADRTWFEGEASKVVAESPRGEFAILDGHAPLLAVLAPGPIRIESEGAERVFAAFGGTLRTDRDSVTLLVESATPVEAIDADDVNARIADLQQAAGDESEPSATAELDRLRTLLRVKERHG